MARPAFTFTVLFLIAASASARSVIELENEPSLHDLTQSDAKSTLLLPSDNPEIKSATVVEIEPETTESNPLQTDLPIIESQHADPARPFTTVVFRPVNRHFPGKRTYRFRIGSAGCHEGMKSKPKTKASLKNRVLGHGREISLENDMVLAAGVGKEFVPETIERQIFPGRVVRFHGHRHHHHNHGEMRRFPFRKHRHEMFAKQSSRKPFRGGEEKKREDEGGIVKRIRKFLYHF